MKVLKNIVVYLCILTILLYSFTPKVYADVPSTQKAVKHSTTSWTGYPFEYSLQGAYFTIDDPTGIPYSSTLNPKYFYTYDHVTFYALEGKELYTSVLNRGSGITVASDLLVLLSNNFNTWSFHFVTCDFVEFYNPVFCE